MLTFPKLAVFDCDGNLDGPERYHRKGYVRDGDNKKLGGDRPQLDYMYDCIKFRDADKLVPRPVEECYDYLLQEVGKIKDNPNIETVAIDTLTMVNEFVVRRVLADQGGKTLMEPHFWGAFKSKILALINRMRGTGKTTIFCIHEVKKTEPDPIKIMQERIVAYEPAIQSGIGDYFGGFFTDMWRCECNKVVVGYEYSAVTMRTKLSELKNSMGLPVKIVDPTYEKILPYMKGEK